MGLCDGEQLGEQMGAEGRWPNPGKKREEEEKQEALSSDTVSGEDTSKEEETWREVMEDLAPIFYVAGDAQYLQEEDPWRSALIEVPIVKGHG